MENKNINEYDLEKVSGGAATGSETKYKIGNLLVMPGVDNIRAIVIKVGEDAAPGYRWYQLQIERYDSVHEGHSPVLDSTLGASGGMEWCIIRYDDIMELNIDRLYVRG